MKFSSSQVTYKASTQRGLSRWRLLAGSSIVVRMHSTVPTVRSSRRYGGGSQNCVHFALAKLQPLHDSPAPQPGGRRAPEVCHDRRRSDMIQVEVGTVCEAVIDWRLVCCLPAEVVGAGCNVAPAVTLGRRGKGAISMGDGRAEGGAWFIAQTAKSINQICVSTVPVSTFVDFLRK